ncbi:MAG: mycothiol system anti-sigma-R factor [Pseudonocardiaceae bacterium]|nr:mycothiol system anti-sigma-R factor [Pseudonocardiaceae bacterium]
MSCGEPHDTDCGEVLAEVWMFLDNECDPEHREQLRRHLDECGPCLEEYGLEEHLKTLLARKCGGDHAPDGLRERLRESIREIVVQQADITVQAAEVTVETADGEAVVEVRSATGAQRKR